MILNETDLTNIRVRLVIRDTDGVLVDDPGTLSAGDLVVSRSGATPVNAPGTLQRTGQGMFYYQGTLVDAQTEGYLLVIFKKTGYRVEQSWVPVVGLSGIIQFPFTVYDNNDTLTTGVVPVGSEFLVSIKGAAWSANPGTFGEIGFGAYKYTHNVAMPSGFIGVKLDKTGYQVAIAWGSIDVTSVTEPVKPVLTILSPAPGSVIGQSTGISFSYIDNVGIRRAMPMFKFAGPNGYYHYELVHDGDNFTPDYDGLRTAVSGGYLFTNVVRKNGWGAIIPHTGSSPSLVPFGFDGAGNETA